MLSKALRAMLVALLLPLTAAAQDDFPSRPVSLNVAFPPGGLADFAARPIAAAMTQALKQPVVVVNKPGAAGAIGNRFVATSAPDGYNILMTLSPILTIPEVDQLFGRKPAHTMDQFVPLAMVAADPPIIVVGAQTPWKSVKELVEDAKKRPDDIVYSHSGLYGPAHMPMEMFLHAAGIRMLGLPAVGGGPTMMLVLQGNAAMWASPTALALPHVQAQKIRALASFGAQRHPAFPDVPTLKELGYDVEYNLWAGMFAPRGTPEAVVATLRDSIRKAVASPEFKRTMDNARAPIAYLDGPEFAKYLEKDGAMLRQAVKRIGKRE